MGLESGVSDLGSTLLDDADVGSPEVGGSWLAGMHDDPAEFMAIVVHPPYGDSGASTV